jgi:hypothetical protein
MWKVYMKVLEEEAASVITVEDGDRRFLRNVDKCLRNYMIASHGRYLIIYLTM